MKCLFKDCQESERIMDEKSAAKKKKKAAAGESKPGKNDRKWKEVPAVANHKASTTVPNKDKDEEDDEGEIAEAAAVGNSTRLLDS
jgi:hypothetical protein